jgi:hypothetical protein
MLQRTGDETVRASLHVRLRNSIQSHFADDLLAGIYLGPDGTPLFRAIQEGKTQRPNLHAPKSSGSYLGLQAGI